MKRITNKILQQEILLVSKSEFAERQYCEKDEADQAKNISKEDKFKTACWNGMVKDMLPELFLPFGSETKMFIWQMRECKNTLTLEFAEAPADIDFFASIDPYCFMELQAYN